MIPFWLTDLADDGLGMLFPERCLGCQRIAVRPICRVCAAQLLICPAAPPPPGLDGLAAGFVFGGPLRGAIHRLKYRYQRRFGRALARLAVEHLPPPTAPLLAVPLHPKRQAERGFNQAAELATQFAQRWQVAPPTAGLVRLRETRQQAKLNRQERAENMASAFAWQAAGPPPPALILVDDVVTTGATLVACAAALRAAGCRSVSALALARAP